MCLVVDGHVFFLYQVVDRAIYKPEHFLRVEVTDVVTSQFAAVVVDIDLDPDLDLLWEVALVLTELFLEDIRGLLHVLQLVGVVEITVGVEILKNKVVDRCAENIG